MVILQAEKCVNELQDRFYQHIKRGIMHVWDNAYLTV